MIIFENFEFSGILKELENLLDFVEKSSSITATELYRKIVEIANKELNSTKLQYVRGLRVEENGGDFTVKLNGFIPNAIEDGVSEFDMKPALLNSPNAKIGKNGKKYIKIPFEFGNKNSVNIYNILPSSIENVLDSMNIGDSLSGDKIPEPFNKPSTREAVGKFAEYQRKVSIYENLIKTSGGGKTFRTVSENSDPMAFIHPGIKKRGIVDKAVAQLSIDKKIDDMLDKII